MSSSEALPTKIFFLLESAVGNDFTLKHANLDSWLSNHSTLSQITQMLGATQDPTHFSFWMYSENMEAAVQLLSDESIFITWSLYCKNDPYVTIIVRKREEPSPNTADSPSKKASLQARSQLIGTPTRSPRIRPYRRVPSESIDVSTREPLSSFPEADQITLELGGDKTETLSKEYLLGWIGAELSHGKAATDVVVEAEDKRGKLRRILLTENIWQTSLLRGNPAKAEFRHLHEKSEHTKINRDTIIKELSREEQFVANSKLFIRDLRQFGSDPEAQDRLNATASVFFLGKPYFSEEQVERMLQLPAGNGSLDYALQELLERKAARGEAEELCSSHDLAPIYEAAFGYSWKKIKSEFQQQGLPDLARLAIMNQPAEQVVDSSDGKGRGKGLRKKGLSILWAWKVRSFTLGKQVYSVLLRC